MPENMIKLPMMGGCQKPCKRYVKISVRDGLIFDETEGSFQQIVSFANDFNQTGNARAIVEKEVNQRGASTGRLLVYGHDGNGNPHTDVFAESGDMIAFIYGWGADVIKSQDIGLCALSMGVWIPIEELQESI